MRPLSNKEIEKKLKLNQLDKETLLLEQEQYKTQLQMIAVKKAQLELRMMEFEFATGKLNRVQAFKSENKN